MLGLLVLATLALLTWSLGSVPQVPAVAHEEAPDPLDETPALQPRPRTAVVLEQAPAVASPLPPPQPVEADVVVPAVADEAVLRGQVVDPQGQPVALAQVVLAQPPYGALATSDAEGYFYLPATTGEVMAVHGRFAPSAAVAASPGRPWQLQLRQGGTLHGRVVDHSGQPQPARVRIDRMQPDPPQVATLEVGSAAAAGADGTFTFPNLRPGLYDLRAEVPGHAAGTVQAVRVTGQGRAEVEIRLPVGASLRGRVTARRDGQPVAGARVLVLGAASGAPRQAVTDPDGRYVLQSLTPGRVTVRVDHEGFRPEMSSGVELSDGAEAIRDVQLAERQAGEKFAFQGIGASLRREGDAVVVGGVMAGMPAESAGVRQGDRILAVDRQSVAALTLAEVIEKVRGEAGTSVLLEVEREGQGRFTLQVGRGNVVVKEPPEAPVPP